MNSTAMTTIIQRRLDTLLDQLGEGRTSNVAYDTAWVARLARVYPGYGFEAALNWLLTHQHADGTWGSPIGHRHDQYVSTLAALIALQEADAERFRPLIERGERALWQVADQLPSDDHDTVGFPILSATMTQTALDLGLDVPQPTIRYAQAYRQKLHALTQRPQHTWVKNPLSISMEALQALVPMEAGLLNGAQLIAESPSATASYLLQFPNERSLRYLACLLDEEPFGMVAHVVPINFFETAWAIAHLRSVGLVRSGDPRLRAALDQVYAGWSETDGIAYAPTALVKDLDDTAACFAALQWGGYPVTPAPFLHYEADDHFRCYLNETDPSASVQIRTLMALLQVPDSVPHKQRWIDKAVTAVRHFDNNGRYWTDKWHTSPYYVNAMALRTLPGLADDLAYKRLEWLLATQQADGGWGYHGQSTPEETAYCLEVLLFWHTRIAPIAPEVLDAAAAYLLPHVAAQHFVPQWVAKVLYTPVRVVQAAILSALYAYATQRMQRRARPSQSPPRTSPRLLQDGQRHGR